MNRRNSIRLLFYALICLIIIQCSNKRVVDSFIVGHLPYGVDSCVVDFSQLPFDWDSVCFISGRIDSPSEISSIIGCDYSPRISDPGTRMVFMHDGEVVYVENWLTTGQYDNYIYYDNNYSHITCSKDRPLFLVRRVIDGNKKEYYIIRNLDVDDPHQTSDARDYSLM